MTDDIESQRNNKTINAGKNQKQYFQVDTTADNDDDDDLLSPMTCCPINLFHEQSTMTTTAASAAAASLMPQIDINSATSFMAASTASCSPMSSWGFPGLSSKGPRLAEKPPNYLPILIIPGFMSSGLEIRESHLRPDWIGKRLWINLSSLGLSSMYFGSAKKKQQQQHKQHHAAADDKESQQQQEEQQQQMYKSYWLEHMRLDDSCRKELPGIHVRPIPGLEGVDYLTPGTFTNHVSYVFGPVLEALRKAGYVDNVHVQAAPYDWRLSPQDLERRDSYFTCLIQQVEDMYYHNHDTPIVLLGHSLGTKTAHYFLNFALEQKGQAWIDQHIWAYVPVGAPHLGAPKALRSVVAGDKMGLDAFLTDEEALALGRSFGSGPWLFPSQLPPGVPACVHVMPHGVLEITMDGPLETCDLVNQRTTLTMPSRYRLIVAYGQDGQRKVSTPFHGLVTSTKAVFSDDKFSFATSADPKDEQYTRIRFFLQEPGLAAAKKDKADKKRWWDPCRCICCLLQWVTCCCIFVYLYRLLKWLTCGVFQGLALGADAITSGVGGGANLAMSGWLTIPPEVWKENSTPVTKVIKLYHKDDYNKQQFEFVLGCIPLAKKPRIAKLKVQMRWIPYSQLEKEKSTEPICSPICQPQPAATTEQQSGVHIVRTKHKKKHEYRAFAGHDILEREGLQNTLNVVRDVYDIEDAKLGPRTRSSIDAPPVRRIYAIYGINMQTEVGGVYKRKDHCLSEHKLKNLYELDTKTTLEHQHHLHKKEYKLKNGVLYETPYTKQPALASADDSDTDQKPRNVSGDGTVPYWSLRHCETWRSPERHVAITELNKAEHREILADARFHEAILDFCRIQQENVQ